MTHRQKQRELDRLVYRFACWCGVGLIALGTSGLAIAGIVVVTQPQHGSAQVVDGRLRYTPEPNYIGPDGCLIKVPNAPVQVLDEGQTEIVFDDRPKIVEVPVSLTVHPDGTKTVKFGR